VPEQDCLTVDSWNPTECYLYCPSWQADTECPACGHPGPTGHLDGCPSTKPGPNPRPR